jgi:hypothetical protein
VRAPAIKENPQALQPLPEAFKAPLGWLAPEDLTAEQGRDGPALDSDRHGQFSQTGKALVRTWPRSLLALAWQLMQELAAGGFSLAFPQNQATQWDIAALNQGLARLRVERRQLNRHAGERAERAECFAHSRGFCQSVVVSSSHLVSYGTHHDIVGDSSACRARKSMGE